MINAMLNSKIFLFTALFSLVLISCNNTTPKTDSNESILKGTATIYVDETIRPIVEDQIAVFESKYDAKIKIVTQSESETINSVFKQNSGIAILTRNLTETENKILTQKKIAPKITIFATDAITFITKKADNDTLIELKSVLDFMKGQKNSKIKGLVFDNPNSSSIRYMRNLTGIKNVKESSIYSLTNSEEVIKFISNNDGMVGIIGINWLTQPLPHLQNYVDRVTVLNVRGLTSNKYYAPTQNNIAENKYPLVRNLYIINAQGYAGLGMGFASFVAGDIGQRIILKSGLLPFNMPGRKIRIRKQIIQNEIN
jgi:phosphate transport system substrate-binding protein